MPDEHLLTRVAFPSDSRQMLERAQEFRRHLQRAKSGISLGEYGWYPYDSLSVLPEFIELIRDDFDEIKSILQGQPALDLGCGDGDLAMLLDHFGVTVDAIDHAETNFNRMQGVRRLRDALNADVRIADVDLDSYFDLPRKQYGVVVFLGILYHLKNPYYALEELARRAAYCVLSTRVARVTRAGGTRIDTEPVAYLLDARETNNDQTNYWIFSRAGLTRLAARCGWAVRGELQRGCVQDSNPVDAEADERAFLLLKSLHRYPDQRARPSYGWRPAEEDSRWRAVLQQRQQHPDLQARPLYGWHQIEEDTWRWTMKDFGIEAALPLDRPAREFTLRFVVPDAIAATGPLTMSCQIGRDLAGSIACTEAGPAEFRGKFPQAALSQPTVRLAFKVESRFQPGADRRDLGVIVPLLSREVRATERLPFQVS